MTVAPNIVKGSLYALLGFFFMAAFGIITKEALHNDSFIWVSFLTYLTGATLLGLYLMPRGFYYLKSSHYKFLVGRAVFGTAASFFYTTSLNYIPLVNGTLLFNTAPIFIPILAMLFLKVRIERSIWVAVAIGFLGIIFIIRPSAAIFTQTGNLVGLASGISLAIAYLLMKLLTATDPGERIIFYYLGIGTLMQLPLLLFTTALPTEQGVAYSVLSGAILLAAQLALVTAYKYAEAAQVGIYQYCTVIFVALLDWAIWGILPSGWDVIGVFFVTVAGVTIIRSSRSKN